MRAHSLALTLLASALLAAPALAGPPAAQTGPFAGFTKEGVTTTHTYDNNPSGQPCIDLATTYRVSFATTPGTVLRLTAAGQSVTAAGAGSVTFMRGVCTSFTITVVGVDVDGKVPYVVEVRSGLAAAVGSGCDTPLGAIC